MSPVIPEAELFRFASARGRTLALVAEFSQEDLDRRPSGGWSVGEILDHLLRAEESNRNLIRTLIELARSGRQPYIRRNLTPTGLGPAFVPRSLLPYLSLPASLMTLFLPLSVRELMVRSRLFPARASEELQPRHGRPAGELRSHLAASVGETRSLLAANADLDYTRMIYQHPFLGANDVAAILRLTAAHEERHQDQIRDTAGRLGLRAVAG
jgi:DinB superfamily